ncbi:hypothetical protein BV25DRAFT_1873312 [Artomyces pyxidatus]|uniref:Uncharacterized protein n=1 Tax=Artomyces pyxidatus TaxID=48021 RepID=A0ACB8SFA0_9AGAM|nr:hypothetical protein BV25DRAFT_1873312 [Artomyces pyxidatus]
MEAQADTHTLKKSTVTKGKAGGKAKSIPELTSDASEEESEEEESWGRKKSTYYSSNAAELDSDDEEANELEEQEAKRLQEKIRDVMAEDDFGLGDVVEVDLRDETIEDVFEPSPTVVTQPPPLEKKAAMRHLEKTSPETLALAYDWEDIAEKLVRSQAKIKLLETDPQDDLGLRMMHLHYQALLTYATVLAFYLHLRASETYAQRPELLRTHPVFARLVQLKQALSTLEELDFDVSGSDLEDEESEDEDEDLDDETLQDAEVVRRFSRRASRMDFEDLAQLLREAEDDTLMPISPAPLKKRKANAEPPKKKRKTGQTTVVPSPIFDLEEPEFIPTKRRATAPSTSADDAYGDATALAAADAADKSVRRRTLRFHTSKIESASNRRHGARTALGGDDDVPYRERKKAKEERMAKEAKARGLGMGGDDLDGEEPTPKKRPRSNDDDDDGSGAEEGADGYYLLIQKQKSARKQSKKEEYEAAKAAARSDHVEEGAEGPRSLTRAILKNRGLTPHRSKSVRNPRVKKRQKFDKAKRSVASQKAVYKGGIGDASRYDGEKTGISKVVKSVRF